VPHSFACFWRMSGRPQISTAPFILSERSEQKDLRLPSSWSLHALYQGTTSQAAEKLASDPIRRGSVSGHDFSRADKANRMIRALHVAEKLTALKGHDFSRATKPIESTWASAPAGCFPSNSPGIPPFSATCLAPAGGFSRSPYKTGPFSVVSY